MGPDRVLGLGSSHGDDAVGWHVVERLRQHPGLSADVHAIEPSRLLDHLDGCRRLVLVDACQSDQPPGTLVRLSWPAASLRAQRRNSSHALGLGDALALAETLGRLPPCVVFWGVVGSRSEPGAGLTPVVRSVLPQLAHRVLDELGSAEPCQAALNLCQK